MAMIILYFAKICSFWKPVYIVFISKLDAYYTGWGHVNVFCWLCKLSEFIWGHFYILSMIKVKLYVEAEE